MDSFEYYRKEDYDIKISLRILKELWHRSSICDYYMQKCLNQSIGLVMTNGLKWGLENMNAAYETFLKVQDYSAIDARIICLNVLHFSQI